MSTANFAPVNFDLPLIAYGMGEDFEERKKDYEDQFEEEYTEDLYYSDIDFECEAVEEELKEFNNKHRWFEVVQESGYYQGIQFQVNWLDRYFDMEQILDETQFNDEDAEYYYGTGETAKGIREEVEKELEEVKEYLMSFTDRGFLNLYKYAQFSNGEAIYKRVGE